jgi:predicted nucleic acid-binding protein
LILVDTSVWVDHLRRGEPQLAELLEGSGVVMHPFVVGEIACGNLADRPLILELLQALPTVVVADNDEALGFIERHGLYGKGIGFVDVHLLASVALTAGASLWTRDKRLHSIADELGLAIQDPGAH